MWANATNVMHLNVKINLSFSTFQHIYLSHLSTSIWMPDTTKCWMAYDADWLFCVITTCIIMKYIHTAQDQCAELKTQQCTATSNNVYIQHNNTILNRDLQFLTIYDTFIISVVGPLVWNSLPDYTRGVRQATWQEIGCMWKTNKKRKKSRTVCLPCLHRRCFCSNRTHAHSTFKVFFNDYLLHIIRYINSFTTTLTHYILPAH